MIDLLFPGLPEDPRLTIGSRARREVPPDRRTVETLDLSSEEEPNQGYSLPNPALPPFPDPVSASSLAGPSTSSAGGASGASKYPKIQPYYSLADIQVHWCSQHTILVFNNLFRHTNSVAVRSTIPQIPGWALSALDFCYTFYCLKLSRCQSVCLENE